MIWGASYSFDFFAIWAMAVELTFHFLSYNIKRWFDSKFGVFNLTLGYIFRNVVWCRVVVFFMLHDVVLYNIGVRWYIYIYIYVDTHRREHGLTFIVRHIRKHNVSMIYGDINAQIGKDGNMNSTYVAKQKLWISCRSLIRKQTYRTK